MNVDSKGRLSVQKTFSLPDMNLRGLKTRLDTLLRELHNPEEKDMRTSAFIGSSLEQITAKKIGKS